jgi:Cft2 family RNA processing exonuclease
MVTIIALGGGNEIGANSYYLNINGRGVLLDSGLHPRKRNWDALPDYNLIDNYPVDAAIISHAHLDHIGSLPYTLKRIPHLRPFLTAPTAYLGEIILRNSVALLAKESPSELPIYDYDLLDMIFHTYKITKYHEEFPLIPFQYDKESKITCEFYEAGHILGATSSLIQVDDLKIFYTGDCCLRDQSLIPGSNFPKEKIDILLMESTNSLDDQNKSKSRKKIIEEFTKNITKILINSGSILIPAFALGKTQEMLTILWNLMIAGKIPTVDIYTGSMSKKISRIYDTFRFSTPRVNKEFELEKVPQKEFRDDILIDEYFKKPSILLAPSGMVEKDTFSYKIAKEFLKIRKNAIFFVGYLDPDSPGFTISRTKEGDPIRLPDDFESIKVECTIKNFRFTSHAIKSDLINIAERLSPRHIFLIHGEYEGQKALSHEIGKLKKDIEVILVDEGEEYKI